MHPLLHAQHIGGVTYGEGTYGVPITLLFGCPEYQCSVGKYCSLAEGVVAMLKANHRPDFVTTYPFSAFRAQWPHSDPNAPIAACKGSIRIGNDVWIGRGALLLSGVSIGDGAVIGAHSVVTKNVPPYAIVAGNPARVVKYRFDQATIDALLRIRWWDWDRSKIAEAIPYLQSTDIKAFVQRYG
jgi:acetyltransferase-like isoleucine patch superfamily enzyme